MSDADTAESSNMRDSLSSPFQGKQKEPTAQDDDLYCLQGALVYIQVETTRFRVPTYQFSSSSGVFAGMFDLPQPDGSNGEGTSPNNPIRLPESIKSADFRSFLKALYPLGASAKLNLTTKEWLSVLRLSTIWEFYNFRKLAIAQLSVIDTLSPTEKVVYGREFYIRAWVFNGLKETVERSQTISDEDGDSLTKLTAFALYRLREKRLVLDAREVDSWNPRPRYNSTSDVEETFKVELDTIALLEREIDEAQSPLPLPERNHTPESPHPLDLQEATDIYLEPPPQMCMTVAGGLRKKKKK